MADNKERLKESAKSRVTFRPPPSYKATLKDYCEKEEVTENEILTKMLRQFFKQHKIELVTAK